MNESNVSNMYVEAIFQKKKLKQGVPAMRNLDDVNKFDKDGLIYRRAKEENCYIIVTGSLLWVVPNNAQFVITPK